MAEAPANTNSLQAHLGNLDPSLAAVLGHLVSNTGNLETRMTAVEASQKAMNDSLQTQIDALTAAVHGSGGAANDGPRSIEHMFQQKVNAGGEDLETVVQKHIQKAMEGVRGDTVDPFSPVKTEGGD